MNYAVWIKDTIIITGGNPIRCSRYFTMYHENGVKKEFGHFGYFNGQGNPIGKVTHMDSLGNIVMTMNYIYPKQSQEEIDEQGIFTFITEIKFHQNGNIMSEKKYSNYVYYEIDEEYKQPLGTWKYYNENGELTKTKEYGEYDRDYYQLSEELEN